MRENNNDVFIELLYQSLDDLKQIIYLLLSPPVLPLVPSVLELPVLSLSLLKLVPSEAELELSLVSPPGGIG